MSKSDKFELGDLFVSPEMPIVEATKTLQNAHKCIVLVVDDDQKLLGVVTDSNIRRAILMSIDMQEPVSAIMCDNPVTVNPHCGDEEIRQLMQQTHCYQIPVIGSDKRVVDIKFLIEMEIIPPVNKPQAAVIMAGGLGTRLLPLTKETPKPLLEVGGEPLLFTIINQLLAVGIRTVYLTVNYMSEAITKAIDQQPSFAGKVVYLKENKKLGTAGPLSLLPEQPTVPLVVMNGDLLTKANLSEMINFHKYEHNVMTIALKEEKVEIPYGVAKLEGTRIIQLQEKPKYIHFINAGIYIIEPFIIDRIPKDTYYDMNTLIEQLIAADLRVGSFPVHEYWLDIGRVVDYEKACNDAQNNRF